MAFPTDWGRRCSLTIQSSKVDATLSDFPVLLNEDALPSSMFDADGAHPALNGGGDIRFSSDSEGTTQLACEVVYFITDNDPANGTAEIWVKISSLSSSADTTIYLWYDKSGETQPARDDTYGLENVWNSSYKLVSHYGQDPSGSAPQMTDSTSNDNHGTSVGTMTSGDSVTGQIGNGLEFDSTDDYINHTAGSELNITGDKTLSAWINVPDYSQLNWILDRETGPSAATYAWRIAGTNGIPFFQMGSTGYSADSAIGIGSWAYVCVSYLDSSNLVSYYLQGATDGTTGGAECTSAPSGSTVVGTRSDNHTYFKGKLDEIRISNNIKTDTWISTEYNNQNDPSTFVVEGTPGPPVPADFTPIAMIF